MTIDRRIAVLMLSAALVPMPAMAAPLYREGQPEVLTPAPPPPSRIDNARSAFPGAYARARKPRIMIFWNRNFSDEVTTVYRDRLHIEDNRSASGAAFTDRTDYWDGQTNSADVSASSRRTLDASVVTDRVDSPNSRVASQPADYQLEGAFTDALIGAGAILIDRSVSMRLTALGKDPGDTPNVQTLEAKALTAKADLLLEVQQYADSAAPSGVGFRVSVRDVRQARIIASFTTTARPETGPAKWVAGRYGFEKATPVAPSLRRVGEQLGAETLSALVRAWQ